MVSSPQAPADTLQNHAQGWSLCQTSWEQLTHLPHAPLHFQQTPLQLRVSHGRSAGSQPHAHPNSSESSAHSKRAVTKKLSHPPAEVTRRHVPNITLPGDKALEGASSNLSKLMHLTNTAEETQPHLGCEREHFVISTRSAWCFPHLWHGEQPPGSLIQCHPPFKHTNSSTFRQPPNFHHPPPCFHWVQVISARCRQAGCEPSWSKPWSQVCLWWHCRI